MRNKDGTFILVFTFFIAIAFFLIYALQQKHETKKSEENLYTYIEKVKCHADRDKLHELLMKEINNSPAYIYLYGLDINLPQNLSFLCRFDIKEVFPFYPEAYPTLLDKSLFDYVRFLNFLYKHNHSIIDVGNELMKTVKKDCPVVNVNALNKNFDYYVRYYKYFNEPYPYYTDCKTSILYYWFLIWNGVSAKLYFEHDGKVSSNYVEGSDHVFVTFSWKGKKCEYNTKKGREVVCES